MTIELVSDDEVLLRSVDPRSITWEGENWHLSSEAFNCRHLKPSVDRKALLEHLERARKFDYAGVVQLIAEEVRQIEIERTERNPETPSYRIDVIYRPINVGNQEGEPVNIAHSQIESAPNWVNRSRFQKLKDKLSRLASKRPFVLLPERS
jgi:hypothetical protein